MFSLSLFLKSGKSVSSVPVESAERTLRRRVVSSWAAFAIFLVVSLPLMICMPLTADPITFDLQALTALEGGVLYRDLVEPNLPGVVWVHMVVRSILGWSTYALRSFDLAVFGGIVLLLIRLARRASSARDFRLQTPLLALLLCWCYFSMSEWAHCQRDVWLMLPALSALAVRMRQLRRESNGAPSRLDLLSWGVVEGLLWGIAFWIKPFVAVPALAALVVTALIIRNWRRVAWNFGGVLVGGVLAGVCGSVWLIKTDAWPHFWDMALNWNPAYFEMGRDRWTIERYNSLFQRFMPWGLLHFIAIPVAVRNLCQLPRVQVTHPSRTAACVLSGVYLGWLLQAHTLQHLFDYAHVPGTLLALALLAAAWPERRMELTLAKLGLASLIGLALVLSPATRPKRLAWWGRCLTEGSTPEVRCGLQLMPLPHWKQLQPVMDFLKSKNLKDGELTAYNGFLIHLYPQLGLRSSTRYIYLDVHLRIFKTRTAQIERALEQSNQRFVVCSLFEDGMLPRDINTAYIDQPPQLPEKFPAEEKRYFPYNQKLVFRSGQYLVYEVVRPVAPLTTRS
ncbi:MAG: hypothetical protein KDA84_02245, partial [Planctomycetaceae bacterium]|nr:hypothetical protein [Planctomycetaceae bacterium]